MKPIRPAPLLALALLALAHPPAVWAEDLMDVYRLAAENDTTFQAAAATFRADTEIVRQARAALLPTLEASADRTRNDVSQSAPDVAFTIDGEATYYSDGYALNLSQPLFDYPLFVQYVQARRAVEKAEFEFRSARQDLILRTAKAYFTVLSATDDLELARAEKAALQRQLDLAKARLDVGMGTVTDLYEARARYLSAVAGEIGAVNALADAREGLAELIGHPPRELQPLGPVMPLTPPDPPDPAVWADLALANNLGVLAKQRAVAVAGDEVRIQRGAHLPTLRLVASDTHNDAEGSLAGPGIVRDSTILSVQLKVPLLQGGLVMSRTAEARQRRQAASSELEGARRAALREVRDAFRGIASQASKVSALRQAVTASESALEGKVKGFEAGLNSNIDVLNAQRDLFLAKRDYSQSRYDYLLNLFRLEQAVGRLDESSLARVNQWLKN